MRLFIIKSDPLLKKNILIAFSIILICTVQNVAYSQESDTLHIAKDSTDVFFEKITLDGNVAYKNEKTNEVISESEYHILCAPVMEVSFKVKEEHDHIDDYWRSDKINPYRDVKINVPFQIKFDQTTFTHPVDDDIVITSRFGRRRRGAHRGLDIDLVTGDFVRSVLPGKVRFVGYSKGHGKTVVVRHSNDVETVYAHLSAYTVRTNDSIPEGQIVGFGGNTGNSRGSHLHLEVRFKGICIHPEYVFNFDGSKTIRGDNLWVSNSWKSPKMHSSYRKSKIVPLFSEEDAIASQDAEPRQHKVRKGDTLYQIALKYSLRVKEICSMNNISQNSILSIGQIIQIR